MRHTLVLLMLALQAGTARAGEISGPMVVSDAWPQATDLASWARDVLRLEGLSDASDRDQAIALYEWTRLFVMSPSAGTEPYEGPWGREQRLVEDVTKVMFVYGCGDCDYQARALEAVWCFHKGDDRAARRVNLMPLPHTMTELWWDGAWHAFDPHSGVYLLDHDSPTANVISFAQEIDADPLVRANEHFEHRARPFFERVRPWDGPGEWMAHLEFSAFFQTGSDWVAAGSPANALFATYSLPSTLPMSEMDWHLPRGAVIERRWSADPVFYRPQAVAARFGALGRHYRQAVEWGPSLSHWNAQEDVRNFPRVEPYLRRCTDPDDLDFHGQTTLYLVGSGTYSWEADLWSDAWLDAVDGASGFVRERQPPWLRPDAPGEPRQVTFRIRTPYVMADAELSATLAAGPADRARLLLSADGGSSWDEVGSGAGVHEVNLGVSRFDGVRQSVSGRYEYLLRFEARADGDPASVGLNRLRLVTRIDGSLNALPRLAAGSNTVRVKVRDPGALAAPIRVEYQWETEAGPAAHAWSLRPADFAQGEASVAFEAPGLRRCVSYSFAYGANDEDGNGLPDTWERLFFGTNGQAPEADPDGDGLSNAEEYEAGQQPAELWTETSAQEAASPRGCHGCGSSLSALVAMLGTALFALRRRKRQ